MVAFLVAAVFVDCLVGGFQPGVVGFQVLLGVWLVGGVYGGHHQMIGSGGGAVDGVFDEVGEMGVELGDFVEIGYQPHG